MAFRKALKSRERRHDETRVERRNRIFRSELGAEICVGTRLRLLVCAHCALFKLADTKNAPFSADDVALASCKFSYVLHGLLREMNHFFIILVRTNFDGKKINNTSTYVYLLSESVAAGIVGCGSRSPISMACDKLGARV